MKVSGENVVLDLNGYRVTCRTGEPLRSIIVVEGSDNTVKNGVGKMKLAMLFVVLVSIFEMIRLICLLLAI